MNDMTKRVEQRQARESEGLATLQRAAELLQMQGRQVRRESKRVGRVAGERLARDAEIWEQAAEKLRGTQDAN